MTFKTLVTGIGKAIIVLIAFGSFAVCCGTAPNNKEKVKYNHNKFIRV